MYCDDKQTCFAEINAYCGGKKNGFVLIVNTENYDIYQDISEHLQADTSKKCFFVSDYCSKNGLPNLDEICELIVEPGCHVLMGLSQANQLRGSDKMDALIGKLLSIQVHDGYGIVLLEHSENYLKKYIANDPRVNQKVVFVAGEESPLPKIRLAQNERLCIDCTPQSDMKHLLAYLEKLTCKKVETNPIITVITSYTLALFSDSIYSVNVVDGIYKSLVKAYPDIACGTEEKLGTEMNWSQLAEMLNVNGSFSAVIDNLFGTCPVSYHYLGEILEASDPFRWWLFWLNLKILGTGGNSYLSLAIRHSELSDDLEKHIFMDLLDVNTDDKNFKQYYSERKYLIENMPENITMIDSYCSLVGKYGKNAVFYLTDSSEKEEYEFLRCLEIYEYTERELLEIACDEFSNLGLYMQKFLFTTANTKLPEKEDCLRNLLSEYFNEYKIQKITNHIRQEFLKKVEMVAKERPYNKLQARSSLVSQIQNKKEMQLFFFDALGVEYLAYIQAKCELYGLIADISIGHCMLPSITCMNKEFIQFFEGEMIKIDDLDELKHHSQVIDYQKCKEPIHLFRELEIIDRELRRIQSMLVQGQFNKAVIVSDHGASRLAVIYNQENQSQLEMEDKGEHSGRCCPVSEDPEISCVAYENDYAILANYERFKGGRKANVEVHGGATLEEVVVPVIVLSRKPENVEICFVNALVKLKAKEVASIILFSNIQFKQPRLMVNDIMYEGEFVGDNKHAKFVMPELKRSRDCTADVYDGNKKIASNLPFRIQKNVGRDTLGI